MNGIFITLEGIDGAGKTTQAGRLKSRLEAAGWTVIHTREPGGTPLGQAIRKQFLFAGGADLDPMTEVLLMAADRAQHVRQVVRPALERGDAVVCERYVDSTEAYQGYGGDVPLEGIRRINALATGGLLPDVTFLLDLDPARVPQRRSSGLDRMESRDGSFHRRVRDGFLEIAARNPERIVVIDASKSPDEVEEQILDRLRRLNRVKAKGGAREL